MFLVTSLIYKNMKLLPFLSIALISLIVIQFFIGLPTFYGESYNRYLAYSPSYLLLSNWVNESILVSAGIWDPYLPISYQGISIQDIYAGHYGLLPIKIYVESDGNSTSAKLTLNNTIIINQNYGYAEFVFPPNSQQLAIYQKGTYNLKFLIVTNQTVYSIKNHLLVINTTPIIKIYLDTATFEVNRNNSELYIHVSSTKNNGTLHVIIGNYSIESLKLLQSQDYIYVSKWLNSSKIPSINGIFLKEYFMSLLVVKDDQNPYTGEFAASPSPIYLYSWVRDGSFAAMSLQDSGHIKSALKYWKWMSSVQIQNGTWYTRYDFWNGNPDKTFGIPEYDSLGLFQIGIWNLYQETHNKSIVEQFIPFINKSINWESYYILKNGLIPKDLSVWEDNYQYNFWTQAMDVIGLKDSALLYSILGLNASFVLKLESILNSTIQKYFYTNDGYAEYVSPAVQFANGKSQLIYIPTAIADSSSLLPIDFGLIPINSERALKTVNYTILELMRDGGLARFTGDDYHYSNTLYDSSGPMPPWIITTLFLALYYEYTGHYSSALKLMNWSIVHSQHLLLPEAVDPNYGNPLPTTSPLTWSSAMYIIVALNYKSEGKQSVNIVLILLIVIIIILAYYLLKSYLLKGRFIR
jgi:GH15 family glucan-1,4-alpha-glucosidase